MGVLDKYMNTAKAGTGKTASASVPSGGSGVLDAYLRGEKRNLYSQATQPQGSLYAQVAQQMKENGGTPGAASPTYAQQNLYSQAARSMPTGNTWEDTNMLARETQQQSRPSYFQLLERNINAAAADPYGGVTPQMVAELRQADDERREEQRQNLQQLERDIAAQGNLYSQAAARVTPGLTGAQRQMIAERGEALSEDADLREVKARLPGLQYTYEAAKNNYQQLMDRNIRLANETGEVPPEQVAELYRAEQAMKQAQQRYNDALARNEQMSYSEKMGGIKTDLSGIAQLLDDRARFEAEAGMQRASGMNDLAADFDRQKEEADAKIEAVREQLRQEGYSDKEIQALFDYQVKLKNAAEMEDRYNKYYSEAVGNSDFENWLLNTSTGLVSGVGYLDLAGQMLMGKIQGADPITGQTRVLDYNTGAQAAHTIGEATMQGEMDKLLEQYGIEDENGDKTSMTGMGKFRSSAYQLAVSMGQSAVVAGMTAMGAPAAMLLLSGNAATSTAHEMHENGYSDGTALLMGAISGAAEYVTEKIGMDQLFKTRDISTAKNVVKTLLGNIVNQSMAEGGEEVLSTVINTLADLLVNKDKSELALRYQELLAQGMTPEEAEKAAAREWMQGAWQDFYMGAISGGLFGMGGTAFQSARNAVVDTRTGKNIIKTGTVQDVLNAARNLDGKIAEAAAMPQMDEIPSARELGAAQRGLDRARVMENMRAELESRGEENVSPELLSALYNSSLEQEQRLTREEQKALRGSRTAMELAAEWSEQWGDNSVPAPFEGLEDILRRQMEQKENAPQEGAVQEGVLNNGEQSNAGEQPGNDAFGTGREGPDYEGRTISVGMDAGDAASQGSDRFQNYVREEVTPAALGVDNGSTTATVKVLDESRFEEGSIEAQTAQRAREMGLEPVFITGTMQIGEGANAKQARAYIKGNRVILQADGPVSVDKLLKHEEYHREARRNKALNGIIRQALANNLSEQELNDLVAQYISAYDGIYDFSKLSQADIEAICEEELFADLYAGIDNTGKTALRDTARGAYADAQTMQQQNAEAEQESTGPPSSEITPFSTEGERYEILKDRKITPANADSKSLEGTAFADLAQFDEMRANRTLRGKDLTAVQNAMRKIASKLKINDIDLNNSKLSFPFRFSNTNVGKSTNHQREYSGTFQDLAKTLSCLSDLVEGAVLIETHTEKKVGTAKENHDLKQTYVLLGAMKDGNRIVPVEMVVKEFHTSSAGLYMTVTLANITGPGVSEKASAGEAAATQSLFLEPTINIQDLIGSVKSEDGRLLKYIPDQFLNDEQKEAKKKALERQEREYDAIRVDGRGSVEVNPQENSKENQKLSYTIRDGVGKLFADQLDRLTEMADQQGTYYDGVQETLMDALLEAKSEDDLDRILVGKDSARFAYSPELTEKLWELRHLIQVNGEAQTRTESATTPQSAEADSSPDKGSQDRKALEREYKERTEAYLAASNRNDTEYDYAGEMARIQEIEKKLGENTTPQTAQSAASSPEGALAEEDDTSSAEQSSAPSPQGEGEAQGEGDAMAELMEVGETAVENDTGKYTLQIRKKGEGYQARISRDGRLDRVQTFETPQEAAEYALSYVDGQTQARTDAELDAERSEQRERPGPHWPTGREYGEEIIRQKENKAAEAATQTLRERIRRANEELKALRRLEKNTGLTQQQKAHMNDIQETLDIMNDELTKRKGRRKAKKEKAGKVTENKPTRSAAEAKNALMDLFHTAAGERAEVGRQIEAKLAEIARTGKITEESRQALYDMLIENGVVPRQAESTYREIRNWLRGQRIYVNEQERSDLGDDFEALRRRAWGAGIYLTNDIRDGRIDGVNGELAETFGENMFPTDEALSDMLNNMIDLADRGKTTQQTLHEAIRGEAKETGVSANEIYADMFSRMDETLRTFAEKAGLEVDLKDRTATQLAEERKRWEDRMERRAQARRESEIRGKVLRGLQRLSKLRGKAGPEIRTQIDEVLQDIDTQARQITPAGLENLQALQRAYEEAREKAGYVDGENMGNWIPNPYVEERLAALGKKHLNDMSLEDVIELGRTVSALENTIRTQNQMIGEEFDATIESYANGVRQEVESAKGAKAGFLHKWLKEEHLSPRRFLDMLGGWTDGTMKKLSQSLENGQTRMLDFQRRATQSFDSFLSKKANRQWLEKASGTKAEWTKYTVLDGVNEDGASYTEIELTPMMKISLFLHSQNMDNLRHIQTGGIVIPNKALYQQGKMAEAYAQGKRVRMNPETVRKIAGELTETERTFANHMITFFDQISKDAINEVSLQLDGFERAGVENYMPIETDRNFLKSDVAGEARAQTVEGIGSIANERIHASNPVMLSDASDVLMRQIDKVSRYYGYAIPIRNFQAVNNYVFHEEGAPFSTSVKEIMNKKWGAGAEQYITKMLEDLQSSGRRGDMMSSALAKLRGNLAGATLMFNPSVAVSQTASYPGAAQAVGWDGLAHGLVAGRVDPKLIEKYTPLYWYRNQGNSTQELGDYMSQKGLAQKLPWILNWIQKMDSATIRRLWAASEYRVSKDNPGLKPGSRADIDAGKDAYYQKVAEVFNRAVYDTQPNYTNMERAQILRSNSDLTKFLTMYKTVPLQYYGMMVEATGRLQAAVKSGNQAKIAEARKYAANTFGGLLAANTVYVAVKALFKGLRKKDKDYRDEEGNLTAGSVAAQLGKDLAETYAGSIIGGAEMYSAAESLLTGSKFYGPEMSALSYVEDMVNAVGKVASAIGEEDPRQAAGALKDAALTLAKGFGVPAENMETYLMAGVRWMFPDVAMEYDNMFGGIDRADMKGMDVQAVSTATNLILQNRTGVKIDKSVTDELARLYSAGETEAVPTSTPRSFTYDGKTVEISDRGAYDDAWGEIVGDNLEALVTSDDYVAYNDEQRAALVNKLYQYATVEARREADPDYSADGNSTYGWTVKADEAVEAGVDLVDAICALSAFGYMTADKDENGNSVSGSKKEKVCHYIDAMDITTRQKDIMYLLAGYKENSLEYTPWHGRDEIGYVTADREKSEKSSGKSTGKSSGRSSGKSSGKKRSGGRGGSRKAAAPKEKAMKGSGLKLPKASSGSGGAGTVQTPKGSGKGTDASLSLIEIIDKFYGGNALAAAMDGGARARGRTEVDFEL